MYDHPIKRAGLAFNRILLSNTKMVIPAIPNQQANKYRLTYKVKYFSNGKETRREMVDQDDMDAIFPPRK